MAKSIVKKIQKQVAGHLENYFEDESFFIVGVSGGPDSMALLYLFHLLGADALAVHINYGKRGSHSNKDQELVEQMAFQWGFECCSVRLNPEDAKGENFQNWAREQRYQVFRDLKKHYRAEAIVTAHHQDDQIETILQKIFRGSSPTAWQGMKTWDGQLFRPLLTFTKKDILDFCEEKAVPYRIDKSNLENNFARNFLRSEFTEKMDELFPGWKKNLLALPEQGKLFETSIHIVTDQVIDENIINPGKFSDLPDILKPAVLKTMLDQARQEGKYSRSQLEQLTDIEFMETGRSIQAGDLQFTRARDGIHLLPANDTQPFSKLISKDQAEAGWKSEDIHVKITPGKNNDHSLALNTELLDWPLTLRTWRSGDKFTPLGMSGTQKISDHLTNRKIPTFSREKALVLCGSDGTIYAIFYPGQAPNGEWGAISDRAKFKPDTQSFLTIKIS